MQVSVAAWTPPVTSVCGPGPRHEHRRVFLHLQGLGWPVRHQDMSLPSRPEWPQLVWEEQSRLGEEQAHSCSDVRGRVVSKARRGRERARAEGAASEVPVPLPRTAQWRSPLIGSGRCDKCHSTGTGTKCPCQDALSTKVRDFQSRRVPRPTAQGLGPPPLPTPTRTRTSPRPGPCEGLLAMREPSRPGAGVRPSLLSPRSPSLCIWSANGNRKG